MDKFEKYKKKNFRIIKKTFNKLDGSTEVEYIIQQKRCFGWYNLTSNNYYHLSNWYLTLEQAQDALEKHFKYISKRTYKEKTKVVQYGSVRRAVQANKKNDT